MITAHVFTDATRTTLLADLTRRIMPPFGGGLTFATSEHGFAECVLPFVYTSLEQAFEYYNWPGTPHLVISDESATIVYEGRVENVGVITGGATITAYGYWRALADLKYTALWSHAGTADWRELTDEDAATQSTEQYLTDNNNRLHISLKKNERYASGAEGGLIYVLPSRGSHDLAEISFDYDFNMASQWTLRVETYTDDFSSSTTEWTLAGTGATQTGTATIALTANRRVIAFEVFNNTGAPVTYTGETGAAHAKATNVRVTAEQASPIYASDIVAELVEDVTAVNPGQLSSDTSGVAVTAVDLYDEIYQDITPADILDSLAARGGYEAQVWERQKLYFRPAGSAGRTFYVDAAAIEVSRELGAMANRIYATYREENGRVLRTAVANDLDSQRRFGLVRSDSVDTSSTSATEAETLRDAILTIRANYALQAAVAFSRLYNASGGLVPLFDLRTGDTIIIRNLPPQLAQGIDNIRSFRVNRTRYSADANGEQLEVEPVVPVPTLVTLLGGLA